VTTSVSQEQAAATISQEQATALGLVACDWHKCPRKFFARKNGKQKHCGKPHECKRQHEAFLREREAHRKATQKKVTAEQKAAEKATKKRTTLQGLADEQESLRKEFGKLVQRFVAIERVVVHNAERFTKQERTLDDCAEMLQAIFKEFGIES
jgi:hypothetical protein